MPPPRSVAWSSGSQGPRGVPAQGWCWGHSSKLPLNVPPRATRALPITKPTLHRGVGVPLGTNTPLCPPSTPTGVFSASLLPFLGSSTSSIPTSVPGPAAGTATSSPAASSPLPGAPRRGAGRCLLCHNLHPAGSRNHSNYPALSSAELLKSEIGVDGASPPASTGAGDSGAGDTAAWQQMGRSQDISGEGDRQNLGLGAGKCCKNPRSQPGLGVKPLALHTPGCAAPTGLLRPGWVPQQPAELNPWDRG